MSSAATQRMARWPGLRRGVDAGILLAACGVLAACESQSTAPPASLADAIAVAGPNPLGGTVGRAAADSLRVRVLDGRGAGVAGVQVRFDVITGGGTITPARPVTRHDGTAAAAWTLGASSGMQMVQAAAAALEPVIFVALAEPGPPATLNLQPSTLSLRIGGSASIAAMARDSFGNILRVPVTWSAEDAAVAAVSVDGVVSAMGAGTTLVRAESGGLASRLTVIVTAVPVFAVTVEPASVTSPPSATFRLRAVPRDSAGGELAGRPVAWSSSAPAVATVDSAGTVTTHGEGSAAISATSEGRTGTAQLKVEGLARAAAVSVSPPHLALAVGDTARLHATAINTLGSPIPGAPFEWGVSAGTMLTVDAAGLVHAMAPGQATVTVRSGDASAAVPVEVRHVRVHAIALAPDSLFMVAGDTATMAATLTDSAGRTMGRRVLEWTSSHPAVATVDSSGRLRAVGPGAATITAAADGRSASAQVRVVHSASISGRVLRLAAGQEHGCALNGAGQAFCWGANWGGQLGDGSTADPALSPRPVAGSQLFTGIAAGAAHSCGLAADGSVFCWGNNSYGQLGTGTTATSLVPARVTAPAGVVFIAIAAGDYHSCGVAASGAAYCWGSQLAGELGVGSTVPETCTSAAGSLPCSTRPVEVAGGIRFTRITAGNLFTCAVAENAMAYCWGLNSTGNLGNGTLSGRDVPTVVAGAYAFASISAGAFHACGLTVRGQALCWGLAEQGQLGAALQPGDTCSTSSGVLPCSRVPVAVTSGGTDYRQIDTGHYQSCAVTPAGDAFCWGLNQGGQLGVPATGPALCGSSSGWLPCSRSPVQVAGSRSFREIVAGGYHTLGLSAGTAFSWGANWYGQLGAGDRTSRSIPFGVTF
jgi:alpha-tubulin suppressor-like RCC1 family protein/uncharacterized protein YjdB